MKHYLKALKQKNSLLFSVGIVMLLVLTLCLSGCSEKKRSTGSNKRSGYHPKSVCIGRGTIFNSLCESSVGVFYGDAAELDGAS